MEPIARITQGRLRTAAALRLGWLALGLSLALCLTSAPSALAKDAKSTDARARGAQSARPAKGRAAPRARSTRSSGKAKPRAREAKAAAKPPEAPAAAPAAEAAAAPEHAPAVTAAAPAEPEPVVATKQADDGVKTFTFGAQEVEGRLKSPQILYFLRRVRAQFDPQPLGHRSFLLELSDTRRNRALR